MELFESYYWKYTILLQKFVGIWCFRERWKDYISWAYIYGFNTSFIITMGLRLYNELGVNTGIVVENFVGEMVIFVIFFKITFSIINRKNLSMLLLEIARDWKQFNDEDDLKIMHKYTKYGYESTRLYAGFMLTAVILFLTFPISSPILDIIIPLENATRPKNLPYYAEYGIDIEENYYLLLAHTIIGGFGAIVVLVSFDLGFILVVQHVIGLFALVKFRLDRVAKTSEKMENRIVSLAKGDYLTRHYITDAIVLHKTVLEYIDRIEDAYNIAWLGALFLNMTMLGGGLAVISMNLDYPTEIFRYSVMMGAILVHFYYVFLPGQQIIDSSEEVLEMCYSSKWYNLSEKTKVLIKIMMIRSLKRSELTGGKFFPLSMDTYCNMMKTGFSLFTVLSR